MTGELCGVSTKKSIASMRPLIRDVLILSLVRVLPIHNSPATAIMWWAAAARATGARALTFGCTWRRRLKDRLPALTVC